jgi:hypothetical protein
VGTDQYPLVAYYQTAVYEVIVTNNLTRYRADLQRLLQLGDSMRHDLVFTNVQKTRKLSDDEKNAAIKVKGAFRGEYQNWYTEALAVVRQIIPDRQIEFEQLYKGDGKRRNIDITNFNIQDWMNGLQFTSGSVDGFDAAAMRFSTQLEILKATERRFESALFDIKQVARAELFDSELDAARELAKHGFFRGAGALAGVVLEKHLAQVAQNHSIAVRKQHPTISDLNDALKNGDVLDVPEWRAIQRLGDLRNLCDHNKNREPGEKELTELIDGVEKLTKTLF